MPKIAYSDQSFQGKTLAVIQQADAICSEYAAAGYSLTLRQLYYQFVARGLIPNRDTEYKRLGSIVNDARMAGLIDWNHIVDRTRNLHEQAHWDTPQDILDAVASQYRNKKWRDQPTRVEVWIEKDALVDVIARPSNSLDLPYFACRGYNSQSNAWGAAVRLRSYYQNDGARKVLILHLGDHDPSGIDMTRDIRDRLSNFLETHGIRAWDEDVFEVRRIALNMDQVQRYDPPPNPAKMTDSRVGDYIRQFGTTSWELDALDPPTIDALIRDEVAGVIDSDRWNAAVAKEEREKRQLEQVRDQWEDVISSFGEED